MTASGAQSSLPKMPLIIYVFEVKVTIKRSSDVKRIAVEVRSTFFALISILIIFNINVLIVVLHNKILSIY